MQTKEELYNIYSSGEIEQQLANNQLFCLKAKRPVLVGKHALLKVNLSVGVSDASLRDIEMEKIEHIANLPYRPDLMMDLSIVRMKNPLWRDMLHLFDGAVGVIPYYSLFDENRGLDEIELMDTILQMAKGGVSFMTLHPTADLALYQNATNSKRLIPMTSRGGYVLLKDQMLNSRKVNLITQNFEQIMGIFKKYGVAVSIGTVFRPGTIWESLDEIQLQEIRLQNYYIQLARKHGVAVMMEGVGHVSLDNIDKYADLIRPLDAPLMPLGPIPSDEIIGFDHLANAIGAITLAQTGVVGIINCVTREEHTGRVPSLESIVEGLKSAKTVAHCYNISKFPPYKQQTEVVGINRGKNKSCAQRGGIFAFDNVEDNIDSGCTRCKNECPLNKIII